MKSRKINNSYILQLEKGEEIITSLTKFCEDNNVQFGSIAGVGGTDNVSLKYFDLTKNDYVSKDFRGKNYEIISLNGNISLVDGKPFAHIHAALGDSDYRVIGGHLGSGVISITCEITIQLADTKINRKFNDEFKLNFLDI